MTTDPIPPGPEEAAPREAWTSPLPQDDDPDDRRPLHPRADGEDIDFESIEMQHRTMSVQR
jgi:hypothetical protein